MEAVNTNKSQGWKRVLKIILPYFIVVVIFQLIGALIAGVDILHLNEVHKTATQLLILYFMSLLGTLLILWLFITKVDKKSFVSIGLTKGLIIKDSWMGLLLGFVLMGLGFICLITIKQLEFVRIQFNALNLIQYFLLFICIAFSEELLCRGYILNNLMISFNKYVALVISAIIFSLFHLGNANVNVVSLIIIFLSGLLLGLPYIYSKKLWFPIALHFSWNFFQGPIFGFNVSGITMTPLIVTKYKIANSWNGGEFGFEGSIVSLIFIVLALMLVYFIFRNRKPDEEEEYLPAEGYDSI